MSSLPPHDLIAAIRNRDPHALSWVYETYGPRLFSYLLRRLGDPDLARDAHHDVFVRFLERADTFEDRGVPLIAWLFRLARNLSYRSAAPPGADHSIQCDGRGRLQR